MKLESLESLAVLTRTSRGLRICRWARKSSQVPVQSIRAKAVWASCRPSYAKQRLISILVNVEVFSSMVFRAFLTSSRSSSTCPTIFTFICSPSRISCMLDISWNVSRHSAISPSTSSLLRLKFSMEKQKSDIIWTPSSLQIRSVFLRDSTPSWWPSIGLFINLRLACRRLPSMMKPICSGTAPALKTEQHSLSKQPSFCMLNV